MTIEKECLTCGLIVKCNFDNHTDACIHLQEMGWVFKNGKPTCTECQTKYESINENICSDISPLCMIGMKCPYAGYSTNKYDSKRRICYYPCLPSFALDNMIYPFIKDICITDCPITKDVPFKLDTMFREVEE